MRRLALALGLWLLACAAASAQVPCLGVGGVNNVPVLGVNCNQEPTVPTFTASISGFAIASSGTDIACLTGSATKVVRVQQVRVSGTAGTLITIPALLIRHSVPDSAGTSVAMSPYALDTNNVATTISAAAYYTANPTINDTAPNVLDVANWVLNTTSASGGTYTLFDYFSRNYMQAPIIRGTSQQLCVNVNSTSPSSALANVNFRWTELPQ